MTTFLVFDLETNGIGSFRPPTQTITQLAFIKFSSNGDIIQEYSAILKGATEIKSHPSITISLEDINNKGIDKKIAINAFLDSIDDPNIVLCSHNFDFDSGLIRNVLPSMNRTFPNNKHICTMKSSTNFCAIPKKGLAANYPGFKFPSLLELSKKLEVNIDETKFHDALYDCTITKNCILKGLKLHLFTPWELKVTTKFNNHTDIDTFKYHYKPSLTEINQKQSTLFSKYSNIYHQSWDLIKGSYE